MEHFLLDFKSDSCVLKKKQTFKLGGKSRRLKPNQVDYWEGALQSLFDKICLKMIDHSSRSTLGPGLDFWVQSCVMPPSKSWMIKLI